MRSGGRRLVALGSRTCGGALARASHEAGLVGGADAAELVVQRRWLPVQMDM